jgi:hypothetical protein
MPVHSSDCSAARPSWSITTGSSSRTARSL